MTDQTAIVVSTPNYLAPATNLQSVLHAYQAKKEFIEHVLVKGVDFGTIPGTGDKPALLKPGSEKLSSFFGLTPVFDDVATVEDWTGADHGGEPFFYYRQKCKLYRGDWLVGTADGSCNSWEKKYRYRNADRVCPDCGKATIFKSKQKPEFYCWQKKGGCGATFKLDDKRITEQETGKVPNPDVAELVNTILKMAQKRALVAAVLIATNASDYFTQDVDDFVQTGEVVEGTYTPVVATAQPAAQPKPTPAQIITELGYPPEPEEAPAPSSHLMTLEMALSEESSTGEKYGGMGDNDLQNRLRGIRTGLAKPDISPEYREGLLRKQDAINMIVADRKAQK